MFCQLTTEPKDLVRGLTFYGDEMLFGSGGLHGQEVSGSTDFGFRFDYHFDYRIDLSVSTAPITTEKIY